MAAPRVRVLAGVLAVALAAPGVALGQGSNPLSPGLPIPNTPAPTAPTPTIINPTTTSTPGGSSFSGGTAIGIAVGAVILLGGISFFIWRDARRRAPVRHAHATAAAGARAGSKRPIKPRKLSPAERRRRRRGRAR